MALYESMSRMKMKYSNRCCGCGQELDRGTVAYGKYLETAGKWVFICNNCYEKKVKKDFEPKKSLAEMIPKKTLAEILSESEGKFDEANKIPSVSLSDMLKNTSQDKKLIEDETGLFHEVEIDKQKKGTLAWFKEIAIWKI